ncbi:MAG: patatin-like phospholipase family protein [Myxococcota bacterium]
MQEGRPRSVTVRLKANTDAHGPPVVGFVLSGGAARGAYEAGVLRFVLRDLAARLGRPTWPRLVSGTSVGALNGLFAAARDLHALANLTRIWQELRIEQVYRFDPLTALRDAVKPRPGQDFGLLDPTPFHTLLREQLPEASLRVAMRTGETWAFIVAATEIATGFNALFVDGQLELAPQPGSRIYPGPIGAVHCRASAAIPFAFPPVQVGSRWYVDGGLRQNTPLRPVLGSGVERALIVGVKQDREDEAIERLAAAQPNKRPTLYFLAGKMLNALMLDPVERDLWSAEYRNGVVDWGTSEFGPDFAQRAAGDLGLRKVDICYLRPSSDLGRIAGATYRARPPKTTRSTRFLLDKVLAYTGDIEADLLSYLYFDREYTGTLEALGYEDARRQEEALARLFL